MLLVDIVSDLHVDRWEHAPFDWVRYKKANIVVIAGDVSDELSQVILELNKACDVYDNVLYVDGNHEHSHHMNDLEYAIRAIRDGMKGRPNFTYLHDNNFTKDGITFVGANAWWDFKICEPNVSQSSAIDCFDMGWNKKNMDKAAVVESIISTSKNQHQMLVDRIEAIRDATRVCVVTHTVPDKAFLSKNYPPANKGNSAHYGNSLISELSKLDKVKYFVFGHNHDAFLKDYKNGKMYINNARGRPQDFNRAEYFPYTINLWMK